VLGAFPRGPTVLQVAGSLLVNAHAISPFLMIFWPDPFRLFLKCGFVSAEHSEVTGKAKGRFLFRVPPFAIRFFENLFRRTGYSNAIPGIIWIREQARASALFPLSHQL
jgi:hypothetical protein